MNDQRPLYARLIKATRENRLFLSQGQFGALIEELAREDGIELPCHQTTVSRWEHGSDVPSLRFRKYVAQSIGMDARDLFDTAA